MFRAVVHVTFAEPDRQKHGLRNVSNMLAAEGGQGEVVVVCHGPGIGLLVTGKTAAAEEVGKLMTEGVRFAACENTMREKAISKGDLLPGVATVPSGAAEVVRKQQEGFGYFRP